MATASYRASSPVIGYMGHLPGSKFHVGSNLRRNGTAYPRTENGRQTQRTHRSTSHSKHEGNDENGTVAHSVGYQFDNDGNPIPREGPQTQRSYRSNNLGVSQFANSQNGTSPVFQIPVQFVHTNDVSPNSLQIPVHPSMLNNTQGNQTAEPRTALSGSRSMHDLARNTDRLSIHNEEENGDLAVGSRASNRTNKRRSKSVATKKSQRNRTQGGDEFQNTAFNGAGGGGWSEGQSLRNLRKYNENMGLPPYTAAQNTGEMTARTPKTGRQDMDGAEDEEPIRNQTTLGRMGRTPAPGYTGHLIEMHRLAIGKNFTDAAKESRKLQQSYREGLNGSFMTTRSHSPTRKRSSSIRNTTRQSRRSQN